MRTATCHPNRRHSAKGLCLQCYNEKIAIPRARAWYEANKARALANCAEWRRTHPEEVRGYKTKYASANTAKEAERSREYRRRCPEKVKETVRASRLRQIYRLEPAEFDALIEKQNGRCAICNREPRHERRFGLNVDHCHRTERVRGLLCNICNMVMGIVDADPEFVERLRRYALA